MNAHLEEPVCGTKEFKELYMEVIIDSSLEFTLYMIVATTEEHIIYEKYELEPLAVGIMSNENGWVRFRLCKTL
jgi:hypothetical protein